MPSMLKKEFGKVDKFFKKNVAQPTNKFFKKGGQAEQALRLSGSKLEQAGEFVQKGAKIGNQIIQAAEASPFGAVLAPALGIARSVVGGVGSVGRIADESGNIIKGIGTSKGVKAITANTLERAKRIQKEGESIQFK